MGQNISNLRLTRIYTVYKFLQIVATPALPSKDLVAVPMLKLSAKLHSMEVYDSSIPFYNGTEVESLDPKETGIRDAKKQRRTPNHAQWCSRRKSITISLSFACGKNVGMDSIDPKAMWGRIQYLFNFNVSGKLSEHDFIYGALWFLDNIFISSSCYFSVLWTLLTLFRKKFKFIRQAASKDPHLRLSLTSHADDPDYADISWLQCCWTRAWRRLTWRPKSSYDNRFPHCSDFQGPRECCLGP